MRNKKWNANRCGARQVSMSFVDEEVRPGQETTLRLAASDPSSLCSVGVIDKSVELMGTAVQLTRTKVIIS